MNMMSYEKRCQRTLNAVSMKPVDKIPFSYNGPAYLALSQGMTLAEYVTDFDKATDTAISFVKQHPGIDTIHTPTMSPYLLCTQWLSEVEIPGQTLPENELWQMGEREVMTPDDYQKIIDMGYEAWLNDFFKNRIGDPLSKLGPFMQSSPKTFQRLKEEANIQVVNGLSTCSPFEGFCGARQLMNFYMDLMDDPELVRAALDVAMDYTYNSFVAQLDMIKPFGTWIGSWRGSPQLLSHDTFMEFVWPDTKKLILAAIDHNVIPFLHFDSCWDSELEVLKELPPKKCILMLDGTTDMRKAREILDDRMCLMGDVPSRMLAYSSASEIYDYVTKLIDDVGPKTGLILSSGCDCPPNAKSENVDAMIQATLDYPVSR